MSITIQSTYLQGPARGFPGMIVNGEDSNRISRTVEDAAGIAFGMAVFQGATDHGVTATPSANFMGVTIADAGVIALAGTTVDTYPQYGTAGILNEGPIYVTTSVNVTPRQPVYVTPAGVFTNVVTANTLIPGTFDETATAGSPVRIRIRRNA